MKWLEPHTYSERNRAYFIVGQVINCVSTAKCSCIHKSSLHYQWVCYHIVGRGFSKIKRRLFAPRDFLTILRGIVIWRGFHLVKAIFFRLWLRGVCRPYFDVSHVVGRKWIRDQYLHTLKENIILIILGPDAIHSYNHSSRSLDCGNLWKSKT